MPDILKLKLDMLFFRGALLGTYQWQALSQNQSEWRRAQSDKVKEHDILASFLQARDPEIGGCSTPKELISEADLLIITGSSTSASAITATIFSLMQYPETLSYCDTKFTPNSTQWKQSEEVQIFSPASIFPPALIK